MDPTRWPLNSAAQLYSCRPRDPRLCNTPSASVVRERGSRVDADGADGGVTVQANAVSDRTLDLRQCQLKGADLRGKVLSGAFMSDADFSEVDMTVRSDWDGPLRACMCGTFCRCATFRVSAAHVGCHTSISTHSHVHLCDPPRVSRCCRRSCASCQRMDTAACRSSLQGLQHIHNHHHRWAHG